MYLANVASSILIVSGSISAALALLDFVLAERHKIAINGWITYTYVKMDDAPKAFGAMIRTYDVRLIEYQLLVAVLGLCLAECVYLVMQEAYAYAVAAVFSTALVCILISKLVEVYRDRAPLAVVAYLLAFAPVGFFAYVTGLVAAEKAFVENVRWRLGVDQNEFLGMGYVVLFTAAMVILVSILAFCGRFLFRSVLWLLDKIGSNPKGFFSLGLLASAIGGLVKLATGRS